MMPATIKSASLINEWFTRCNTEPCTAIALCSPKTACIPVPTRMKPICDIEEHAIVLLKLVENTASIAPVSIVRVPAIRITSPHV